MTYYTPFLIKKWPQVLLNGLLRPHRFFSNSNWSSRSHESLQIIFVTTFAHVLFLGWFKGNFILMDSFVVALSLSIFFFAFSSLLHALGSVGLVKFYGKFNNFLSFISYLCMVHLMLSPIIFYSTSSYHWSQIFIFVWGVIGFCYSFIGFESFSNLKSLIVYLLGLSTLLSSLYFSDFESWLPEYSRTQIRHSLQREGEKSFPESKMGRKELFEHYLKRAPFKKGDHYYYKFKFSQGGVVRKGRLNIKVQEYNPLNKVAKVRVIGFYNKKKFEFEHPIYTVSQSRDYSNLMKSQRPGVKTTLRLLTTSLGTINKLPTYGIFDVALKREGIRVLPVRRNSYTVYRFENVPNILKGIKSGIHDDSMSFIVSQRSALPIELKSSVGHKTQVEIQLVKKSSKYKSF